MKREKKSQRLVVQGYHVTFGWEDVYTAKSQAEADRVLRETMSDGGYVACRIVSREVRSAPRA